MLQVLPLREEVAQLRAHVAEEAGEAQGREEARPWPTPTSALAATRSCSACADVGPPLQQRRGQAGRDVRRQRRERARRAGWAAAVAPEQEVDLVLPGHDRALDLGDLGRHLAQRGLGARGLQRRGGAALEPAVEEVVGVLEGGGRAPRDLQLGVQLAQLEVGRGDVGHERQQDAAPRLLGGEVLGARRLVQPPDAAPEVELPREADVRRPLRLGLALRGSRTGRGASRCQPAVVVRPRGRTRTAGDAVEGARLLDARRGQPRVEAVRERLVDQALQHRVVEDVPPGQRRPASAPPAAASLAVECAGHGDAAGACSSGPTAQPAATAGEQERGRPRERAGSCASLARRRRRSAAGVRRSAPPAARPPRTAPG